MNMPGKNVLLAGLEPAVAEPLTQYLEARGLTVSSARKPGTSSECDLVFCQTRQPELKQWLAQSHAPVVVVSQIPDVNDWLDAMDAGAADYCAAPFEREQLDWILESNLGKPLRLAA
jgi:DNA-binding NtrC family response regulator